MGSRGIDESEGSPRRAAFHRVGTTLLMLSSLACGPAGGDVDASDGGIDALVDAVNDAEPFEACSQPDGYAYCDGSYTVLCCGGRTRRGIDGICLFRDAGPIDAGVPLDCSIDLSAPGCPCDAEGATACPGFFVWRRVCRSGVWENVPSTLCC